MNIVIFGCDNSGKSFLAEQLAGMYRSHGVKANVVHSPGPVSTEKMIEFMESELLDGDSEDVKIFDRLPIIEERVYGNILRGKSNFEWDSDLVNNILNKVNLFIYCYPGLFTILNWGTREQYEGVKENALDIINEYNHIAVDLKRLGHNLSEYNYNHMKYWEIVDEYI